MYDEDKTLNFTTQNSILHYGRKGMKWGENIFEDDETSRGPINRQANRHSNSFLDRVGHRAAYAYGGAVAKTSRAKNAIKNSKVGKAYSQWDQDMSDMMDQHIANKQAKQRAESGQQEKMDKMNSVSDETREQVRQVTSNLSELEKYSKAYDEGILAFYPDNKPLGTLTDKDKKQIQKKQEAFTEKFMNKYGDKINSLIHDYNEGINNLTSSGLEGLESNTIALNGKNKAAMDNLHNQIVNNKNEVAKKSKNIVYGNYK